MTEHNKLNTDPETMSNGGDDSNDGSATETEEIPQPSGGSAQIIIDP